MSRNLEPRTVRLLENARGERVVVAADTPFPAILYLGVFVLAGLRGLVDQGKLALVAAILVGLGLLVLVGVKSRVRRAVFTPSGVEVRRGLRGWRLERSRVRAVRLEVEEDWPEGELRLWVEQRVLAPGDVVPPREALRGLAPGDERRARDQLAQLGEALRALDLPVVITQKGRETPAARASSSGTAEQQLAALPKVGFRAPRSLREAAGSAGAAWRAFEGRGARHVSGPGSHGTPPRAARWVTEPNPWRPIGMSVSLVGVVVGLGLLVGTAWPGVAVLVMLAAGLGGGILAGGRTRRVRVVEDAPGAESEHGLFLFEDALLWLQPERAPLLVRRAHLRQARTDTRAGADAETVAVLLEAEEDGAHRLHLLLETGAAEAERVVRLLEAWRAA